MAKLVSKTYGDALFAVACEEECIDEFFEAAVCVVDSLWANEEFSKLMNHPNIGKEEKAEQTGKSLYLRSAFIGLVIGCYDGFFGPGTGTFMVMAFTSLLGYSLIRASGNAKLVNLASNIGGLIAYIYHGNVLFLLGIPAAICSILGNYIGTKMAIKIGGKFIRPVLLTAMGLLVIKLIWDTLS